MEIEASRIHKIARESAQANAEYENAKNVSLIGLFTEESTQGVKRTESVRQAIYRDLHKDLRLNRELKKNEVEATKTYINLLGLMQSNLQSQLNLEKESQKY